jgi:protoporphyrinogen oxidase
VEKVWGMSCDEISADWAAQRIKGLSLSSAVTNALKKSLMPSGSARCKDGEFIKTLIESFQYPRKGPGMMWDAAAAKTKAQGGEVLMGHTLKSLAYDSDSQIWTIEAEKEDGEVATFQARHVISSAPVRELVEALPVSEAAGQAARDLRYRDFLTVALVVEKPDLFPDNWIYIHEPSVKVGRIQNFRSWSPEMVPNPEQSCLGLEYFCFEGEGLWAAEDSELLELAKRELAQIGLADEGDVKDGCVVRQKKAYPVYDDAYKANVETLRAELAETYPTLHLVGRNGMHKYNNQDHSMLTAMLTVENITTGSELDIWSVNVEADYHETDEDPAAWVGTADEGATGRDAPVVPKR